MTPQGGRVVYAMSQRFAGADFLLYLVLKPFLSTRFHRSLPYVLSGAMTHRHKRSYPHLFFMPSKIFIKLSTCSYAEWA
jgi:hypothetical protein